MRNYIDRYAPRAKVLKRAVNKDIAAKFAARPASWSYRIPESIEDCEKIAKERFPKEKHPLFALVEAYERNCKFAEIREKAYLKLGLDKYGKVPVEGAVIEQDDDGTLWSLDGESEDE